MSKATFNGETRRININADQTAIDVKLDLYSDWKEWVLEDDNAKYLPAFSTTGGDEISDSESVGDYYFLENGWKIKPQEANHVLTVTGNLFSRDGSSPFVETDGFQRVGPEQIRGPYEPDQHRHHGRAGRRRNRNRRAGGDIKRTYAGRHPGIQFNGDFEHGPGQSGADFEQITTAELDAV